MTNLFIRLRFWKDTKGQDMIEYALMAGFVAVAAAAIMPPVSDGLRAIFQAVGDALANAASQGGGS